MRVDIHEAGRDQTPFRVEGLTGVARNVAHRSDLIAGNRDIALDRLGAGTVHDGAILDKNIVGHVSLRGAHACRSETLCPVLGGRNSPRRNTKGAGRYAM